MRWTVTRAWHLGQRGRSPTTGRSCASQRTFVCQHLAEVAVLNPRAAQLAPIAVHRAFAAKRVARIVGHRSRANLRSPMLENQQRSLHLNLPPDAAPAP